MLYHLKIISMGHQIHPRHKQKKNDVLLYKRHDIST